MDAVLFSSKYDSWTTPPDFFRRLDDEFKFNLDVASSEDNHLCSSFYTISDNALSKPWTGTCFCNPPYSRGLYKWIQYGYQQSLLGNTIVFLIPSRTDTKWFHDFCLPFGEIRFIKGRLKFGGSHNSAPFPSMVVIFHAKSAS